MQNMYETLKKKYLILNASKYKDVKIEVKNKKQILI